MRTDILPVKTQGLRPLGATLATTAFLTLALGACGASSGEPTSSSDEPIGSAEQTAVATTFPAGTICNNTGTARTPPSTIAHAIVIMMENQNLADVQGNAMAPYFTSISNKCGHSTQFLDNMFGTDNEKSLPHYLAYTSGSNCKTGLGMGTGTSGCIHDDAAPSHHKLSTRSIFSQVSSWKAYEEGMTSACDPTGSSPYAVRHNPPPYYTTISTCAADDVGIAAVTCPATTNATCGTPNNAFTQALANGTLAAYTFVTPNTSNDMHSGSVSQGDNWLHTYLPLIFDSTAYLNGQVVVYIMWDEGSPTKPQPNAIISPYIAPTVSNATMNLFSVLRANEDQLGITEHLGCASGTKPGGGACPAGSTASLRAIFNF
jgi:hypothetical protein